MTTRPLVATEAEIAVVGGCLIDPEAILVARRIVTPDMLTVARHRLIYRAMIRAADAGQAIDPVTISEDLSARGELEDAGGLPYLAELLDAVPTAANLEHHAQIVAERAARRREVEAARQVIADADDPSLDLAEVRARRALRFAEVDDEARHEGTEPPVLTGHELFAEPVTPPNWLVSPLFQRARQGVIYSRPGLGKSMLSRHIVTCLTVGAPVLGRYTTTPGRVLWVTAEEDRDDLRRGLAMTAAGNGVDLDRVLDHLTVLPLREHDFRLGDAGDRAWLDRLIGEISPALVILDAAASLSGADLKDDMEVMPLMRWGSRVSTSHETTVLWLAHDKKDREADDLEALFGSRQNAAQMDFAYRLLPVKHSQDVLLRCTKMRGAAAPNEITIEVVIRPDELHSMRATTGMSRVSQHVPTMEAIQAHLTANPGESMSRLRDTVAEALKRRPADVGRDIHSLMRQGFIDNQGSDTRFKLHWVGTEACPTMSHHVPDTAHGQHVPRVPPPVGGDHEDMGHDPANLRLIYESPKPHPADAILDDEEVA